MDRLLAEPAAHVRQLALWEHLRSVDEAGVQALLAALPLDPEHAIANGLRPLLFRRWGELDPRAALQGLERADVGHHANAEAAVIRGWATRDAAAAFDWIAAEHGKGGRNGDLILRLTKPLVASVGESGTFAELAGRLSTANPWSNRYVPLFIEFSSAWARTDTTRTLHWLSQLPEGTIRSGAITAALRQISREAPDLALGIAQTLTGEKERTEGFQSVFSQWGRQQPEQARRVIDTQLTGRDRDAANAALVPTLARSEPQAAVERVVAIEDSQLRRRAATEVRYVLNRDNDLEFATLVQLRLLGEDYSSPLAEGLAADFARRDPAAVAEFLRTTTLLTAAQREAIEAARTPKP